MMATQHLFEKVEVQFDEQVQLVQGGDDFGWQVKQVRQQDDLVRVGLVGASSSLSRLLDDDLADRMRRSFDGHDLVGDHAGGRREFSRFDLQ